MSLVGVGIESGFAEMGKGCIIIYPKRVINSAMLKQVIEEIRNDGYVAPEVLNYNQPLVFKKKEGIDMTEVAVKLFALSSSYGINTEVKINVEGGTIQIGFAYKNKYVQKSFDVEMLCAMEKDYLIGWLETTLQNIEKEFEEKKNESN